MKEILIDLPLMIRSIYQFNRSLFEDCPNSYDRLSLAFYDGATHGVQLSDRTGVSLSTESRPCLAFASEMDKTFPLEKRDRYATPGPALHVSRTRMGNEAIECTLDCIEAKDDVPRAQK
ncbi:hypothetical protein [Martelella sp. FOR1707]